MNTINDKIKLVIWDLDETFWKGTLSEEGINYVQENHNIVVELSHRGIISSICSKNNFEDVEKVLTEKQLWKFFVFPEIDWLPKGQLVKKIIEDMGLRPVNVLFIDDNLGNLNEVEFFNKGISVCEPSIIPFLLSSPFLKGKDDTQLSRLSQYKILEQKRAARESTSSSNDDFLRESEIKVTISTDVLPDIGRVFELVERTNQLNYTKYRCSKEQLLDDINTDGVQCGHIAVQDRFGSYGISGFYLIKRGQLIHFLFSCRSMNMGVESWLYNHLEKPLLDVVGDVAIEIDSEGDYSYIELINKSESTHSKVQFEPEVSKMLMMGGCDLDQIVHYLPNTNVETDFNYVNHLGLNVHKEHSELIKQLCYENNNYDDVLDSLPILEVSDKNYSFRTTSWDFLIYSPLNDYSRGLYVHRHTGFVLPFDSFNIDWSDENNWKELPAHLINIPKSFLKDLRDNYKFIGPITPQQFKHNLTLMVENYPTREFIFLSGACTKLTDVASWENGMEARHTLMNDALFELQEFRNVTIIDVNELIQGDVDFEDNLRHYKKKVYLEFAKKISLVYKNKTKSDLQLKNSILVDIKLLLNRFVNAIKRRVS